MIDVDQILRDHAVDAAIESAPDGWDRLVARLEDEPAIIVPVDGRHHGVGRPGRAPALVAVAVVLVVLVAAGVVLARSGDEGSAPVATDPTAPPATSGPPTTPGFRDDVDIDQASRPDRIVAVVDHDGDGLADLVRFEGLGIMEDVETSAGPARGLRKPEATVLLPGSVVAPATIDSVDLGPDEVAYVAVGGEVRAIGVTDGVDDGTVAEGWAPAISGDGQTLAVIVGDEIHLRPTRGGAVTVIDAPVPGQQELTGLALSPDGHQLARQRVARDASGVTGSAVDVTDVDDPDGWVEVERSSGVGLPAFMPDGHLALGLGAFGASAGHDEVRASEIGMVDLSTGVVRWSVGGGGFSFAAVDATPDGRWVFAMQESGIRAFAAVDGWLYDNGSLVGIDGLVDAAW